MAYQIYTNHHSDDDRFVDCNEDSRFNLFEQNAYDSEEDTDDASETEYRNNNINNNNNNYNNGRINFYGNNYNNYNNCNNDNNHELKEQMYQHKLTSLQKQLDELKQQTHPDYLRRVKKLEYQCKERLRLNEIYRDYLKECVERDYILEKKAAQKEYEDKKIDLKDNILTDFEERRKLIENERYSLELTNDSMEIKPTVTRKLRRRPNDPVPVVEKRRKPTTGQLLIYMLDEKEIESDLKCIQRGKPLTPTLQQNGVASAYPNNMTSNTNNNNNNNNNNSNSNNSNNSNNNNNSSSSNNNNNSNNHQHHQHHQHQHQNQQLSATTTLTTDGLNQYIETRIEDGKLLYEKRWFHRGQQVYVEGKDLSKFAATISAIGNEVVWVKKSNDSKVKINMSHLAKGKITIKRRAN